MPKFRYTAYLNTEMFSNYMKENSFTKQDMNTLLGYRNLVSDIFRRGYVGLPTALNICKQLDFEPNEFIDHCLETKTGKRFDLSEIEETEEEEKVEEMHTEFNGLPFTEEDFLVPKKPDVTITNWVVGDRKTTKITFTDNALKRLNAKYVRIAIKNDNIFFISTSEDDDSKYVVSDNLKGINITDDSCVKRMEKYLGKYELKFNELFGIYYVEGGAYETV